MCFVCWSFDTVRLYFLMHVHIHTRTYAQIPGSTTSVRERDYCSSTCGDFIKASDEECDGGEWCDTAGGCRLIEGWICSYNTVCAMTSCTGRCGDGQRKGTEIGKSGYCDDANILSNDGCSSTCTVECGWNCSSSNFSSPDFCLTSCGDGQLAGIEQCDDSNVADNDGCSSTCTVEDGWR